MVADTAIVNTPFLNPCIILAIAALGTCSAYYIIGILVVLVDNRHFVGILLRVGIKAFAGVIQVGIVFQTFVIVFVVGLYIC